MFLSIDHPAIACYDVHRQIDWYCTHLGMRVLARSESSAIIGYDDSTHAGAMIELMPARDQGFKPEIIPRFCPGLRHLALRVKNFDAAYRRLAAAGIQFLGEPGAALGGGRIISFRDPEGNELQIVER